MLAGFVICLVGGMPIGFALALSALIFILGRGHAARGDFRPADGAGIDNFVLLAIRFFILVGYLMEATGCRFA